MEMKDLSMHGEDLNGFDVFSNNQEVVVVVGKEDEEIWFETASQHHQNSFITTNNNNNNDNNNNNKDNNNNNNNSEFVDLDVSDPSSLFYAEFPALPDFPCKSSSSSSNRVASKRFLNSTATSSSSASTASSGVASWAVINSDADHDPNSNPQNQQGVSLVLDDVDVDECMDMMENLGCMDLLESTDICWDPSPLFENEPQNSHSQTHSHDHLRHEKQQQHPIEDVDEEHLFRQFIGNNNNNNSEQYVDLGQSSGAGGVAQQETGAMAEDDLGMVFFEWLKTNKETVSAEDLRNIKIKKSTIESAAKRLGGGKEGMKQLLKLILQWVQNHHLHNNLNPNSNPNPNSNSDFHCMNPPTWSTQDMGPMVPIAPSPGFMMPHMGADPYGSGYPPVPGPEYHSWAQPAAPMQYGMGPYGSFPDPGFGGYPAPYPGGLYYHPGPGEGLVRLGSSATKEARKKRMARQRRLFTHQHHRNNHHNHNHQGNNNQMAEMSGNLGHGNCGVVAPHPSHANWVYWPQHQLPPVPPPPQMIPSVSGSGHVVGTVATQQDLAGLSGFPRQVGGVEKKQGWKTEKNLRFLLQKVLKQSDVGNLGRIVLPKKEAEMHLPELEARDGIPIAMEDIGTSRVWNMRYRFWPNNKSRMYLLENTGDFVRSNGLLEGDFIVIYSDVKCGKYMIRGVKVRPSQQDAKPETTTKSNKPSKTQKIQGSSTPSSLNMMQ